jgi:serine/threonine protein kinase
MRAAARPCEIQHDLPMSLNAGTRLGPYEISAMLGAGGMGEVYPASDTRPGRSDALNLRPADWTPDPERKLRFEREARAVAALNHPNIRSLYDVGSQDGIGFLVMEFLEGQSLADRLARGPLPIGEALRIAVQVADAAAHDRRSDSWNSRVHASGAAEPDRSTFVSRMQAAC